MMNHFLVESGSGAATGGSAADPTAAGCSAGESAAGGSAACASGSPSSAVGCPAVVSSQTNRSSSCILLRLLCESPLHAVNRFHQHRVHNLEVGCEGEDGKDDNGGRALHLLSIGPGDALHFKLQLRNIVLGYFRPLFHRFEKAFGRRSFWIVHFFRGHLYSWQGRRDSNPHSRFWRPLVCR